MTSEEKVCLSNVVEQYRLELLRQAAPNEENIHLLLCGGMGTAVFVMRQLGANLQVHENNIIISGKSWD